MSIPGTALAIGFNALFAEAVPPAWRGHVAGMRNALLATALIATSLLCGLILNRFPFATGYQIVFGLGFLGAMLSSLHLWFVRPLSGGKVRPRTGHGLGDMARPGILRIIGDSLRSTIGLRFLIRKPGLRLLRVEILRSPFGKVVAILFAFHLALHLSNPIYPLYWIEKLHLSDYEISLGTAVFYITVFLGSFQLNFLTQKLGNRRVTAIGAIFLSTYPGLTAVSRGFGLILLASVIGGLAWALASGALNNYLLEKVPPDDRPAYLAWYNLALNAAILLGSLAGPYCAGMLGLSTALALFAICRLLAALSILRWG
jgi:MFS family permease